MFLIKYYVFIFILEYFWFIFAVLFNLQCISLAIPHSTAAWILVSRQGNERWLLSCPVPSIAGIYPSLPLGNGDRYGESETRTSSLVLPGFTCVLASFATWLRFSPPRVVYPYTIYHIPYTVYLIPYTHFPVGYCSLLFPPATRGFPALMMHSHMQHCNIATSTQATTTTACSVFRLNLYLRPSLLE